MSAAAPAREFDVRAGNRTLALGRRPWLMGIVNASPDSFSDDGGERTLEDRVALARQLLDEGADMIDIGGESAITGRPPLSVEQELERVVPLVARVSGELGAVVSVDTYKPAVARSAVEAGAAVVNDVSGLLDPGLADVCAQTGAALVIVHTLAPPKQRLQDPRRYFDVTAEVIEFLAARMAVARERGVAPEQLIIDPGPDFAKTPAQTIELLAGVERLHALGRPLLMAISRKDFVGALTRRRPRERLAGTLAALEHGVTHGAHVFRVHDVGACVDYLTVRAALRGELRPAPDLAVPDDLRHERRPE